MLIEGRPRSSPPPPHPQQPWYFVPGYGQARKRYWENRKRQLEQEMQRKYPSTDGAPSPAGTGPFARRRRGRTNPTPGSATGRRRPRWD
jgi:hypothetical protein